MSPTPGPTILWATLPRPEPLPDAWRLADDHVREGRVSEGLSELWLWADDVNTADAFLLVADACETLGQTDLAVSLIERAAALDPAVLLPDRQADRLARLQAAASQTQGPTVEQVCQCLEATAPEAALRKAGELLRTAPPPDRVLALIALLRRAQAGLGGAWLPAEEAPAIALARWLLAGADPAALPAGPPEADARHCGGCLAAVERRWEVAARLLRPVAEGGQPAGPAHPDAWLALAGAGDAPGALAALPSLADLVAGVIGRTPLPPLTPLPADALTGALRGQAEKAWESSQARRYADALPRYLLIGQSASPAAPIAQVNAALLHILLRNAQRAEDLLVPLRRARPDDPRVCWAHVICALSLGQQQDALNALLDLLSPAGRPETAAAHGTEDDTAARVLAAALCARSGDYGQGVELLDNEECLDDPEVLPLALRCAEGLPDLALVRTWLARAVAAYVERLEARLELPPVAKTPGEDPDVETLAAGGPRQPTRVAAVPALEYPASPASAATAPSGSPAPGSAHLAPGGHGLLDQVDEFLEAGDLVSAARAVARYDGADWEQTATLVAACRLHNPPVPLAEVVAGEGAAVSPRVRWLCGLTGAGEDRPGGLADQPPRWAGRLALWTGDWERARDLLRPTGGSEYSLASYACRDLPGALAALTPLPDIIRDVCEQARLEEPRRPIRTNLGRTVVNDLAEAWQAVERDDVYAAVGHYRRIARQADAVLRVHCSINEVTLLARSGQWPAAATAIDRARRDSPRDLGVLWLAVTVALLSGRRGEALDRALEILDLQGHHGRARAMAGALFADSGRPADAVAVLRDLSSSAAVAPTALALHVHCANQVGQPHLLHDAFCRLAVSLRPRPLRDRGVDPPPLPAGLGFSAPALPTEPAAQAVSPTLAPAVTAVPAPAPAPPASPPAPPTPRTADIRQLLAGPSPDPAGATATAQRLAGRLLSLVAGPDPVVEIALLLHEFGAAWPLGDWLPPRGYGPTLYRALLDEATPEALYHHDLGAGQVQFARGLVALAFRDYPEAVRQLEGAVGGAADNEPLGPGRNAGAEYLLARLMTLDAGDASPSGSAPPLPLPPLPSFDEAWKQLLAALPRPAFRDAAGTVGPGGRQACLEANTLLDQGRPEAALERLRQATGNAAPTQRPWMKVNEAVLLLRLGRLAEAVALFREQIQLHPRDPGLLWVAVLLPLLGDTPEDAEEPLRRATESAPLRDRKAEAARALLAARRGDPEPALRLLAHPKIDHRWLYPLAALALLRGAPRGRVAEALENHFPAVPEAVRSRPLRPNPGDGPSGSPARGSVTLDAQPGGPKVPVPTTWDDAVVLHMFPRGGLLECGDLFVARTPGRAPAGTPPAPGPSASGVRPLLLLLDGSPAPGAASIAQPRRYLFQLLARIWPELSNPAAPPSPAEVLGRLGEELFAARDGSQGYLYCSAVCLLKPSDEPGDWHLAEVGDTKVFLCQDGQTAYPVWHDPLPTRDHRIPDPLGTRALRIRAGSVSLAPGQSLLLLTDGAYSVLENARAIEPVSPGGPPGGLALQAAVTHLADWFGQYGDDDATFVVVTPPWVSCHPLDPRPGSS